MFNQDDLLTMLKSYTDPVMDGCLVDEMVSLVDRNSL
jgi:hypothetical protein